MNLHWIHRETPPIASAAAKANRTPWTVPYRPMRIPPNIGPRAMGIRLTREWRVTPMTRLSFWTEVLTRLMMPGSETAVQLMKSTAPARTACCC